MMGAVYSLAAAGDGCAYAVHIHGRPCTFIIARAATHGHIGHQTAQGNRFKISHWFMSVGAHRDAPVKHRDAPVTSGSSRTAPTKPIAMGFDPTRKFEAITLTNLWRRNHTATKIQFVL
jgi:hypothetical protein